MITSQLHSSAAWHLLAPLGTSCDIVFFLSIRNDKQRHQLWKEGKKTVVDENIDISTVNKYFLHFTENLVYLAPVTFYEA